jgi:hypothetical protein
MSLLFLLKPTNSKNIVIPHFLKQFIEIIINIIIPIKNQVRAVKFPPIVTKFPAL